MPFKLDQRARDRWVRLMEKALEDAQLPKESHDLLCAFFHHMATFLMNSPG
jgi:hemoglobin